MLPSWIIEEIKKREGERLHRDERPRVELPLEPPPPPARPSNPPDRPDREDDHDEAIVVIDFG
jgi:hypothetical protein